MKKILFSLFTAIIISTISFAQNQPVISSDQVIGQQSGEPIFIEQDGPTSTRDAILLWSQWPQCEDHVSSEVISNDNIISNCADDFILTYDVEITAVRWWFGFYQGLYSPFTNWTITIYDNSPVACLPGNELYQWIIPWDQSHERLHCAWDPSTPQYAYDYWADLTTPFMASANTRYWISIQAGDHVFPGQWGWDATTYITGCIGAFRSEYFGYPSYTLTENVLGIPFDFAFELYSGGSPFQVPISNWAIAIGIILIFAATMFRLRRS
jgi:hypothetical protein